MMADGAIFSLKFQSLLERRPGQGTRQTPHTAVTRSKKILYNARMAARSIKTETEGRLNTAHGICEAQKSRKQASAPIWPISRVRVWQIVKGREFFKRYMYQVTLKRGCDDLF